MHTSYDSVVVANVNQIWRRWRVR